MNSPTTANQPLQQDPTCDNRGGRRHSDTAEAKEDTMTQTTQHLTCTETAKLLRAALKSAFPGVRFRVRSHTYSMGASIHVGWTDGPFQVDVQRICDLYRGSTFDGMLDLKTHHDSLLSQPDGTIRHVHFGADHVFATRTWSDAYREQLRAAASKVAGRELSGDGTTYLTERDCWDNQLMHQLSTTLPVDHDGAGSRTTWLPS